MTALPPDDIEAMIAQAQAARPRTVYACARYEPAEGEVTFLHLALSLPEEPGGEPVECIVGGAEVLAREPAFLHALRAQARARLAHLLAGA